MKQHSKIKRIILFLGFMFPTAICGVFGTNTNDGNGNINIRAVQVQGTPKTNSIQATIDGHVLSVVFLENLGQVYIELSDDTGSHVDAIAIYTPNGVNFIITYPNRYIVTFTLENGDEYVGEFEVTD